MTKFYRGLIRELNNIIIIKHYYTVVFRFVVTERLNEEYLRV